MVAASQVKTLRFNKPPHAHRELMIFLDASDGFKKAISQATSDEGQVKERILEAKKFFEKYLV